MHTILIVDDEEKLLEVLSVALEGMGYATLTAESSEKALNILDKQDVHLILSDLRLPGLSGRELMERVKKLHPDLPVVIMTAYASLKDAVEIIKEGAFDYVVKPFDLDALEATVASALRFYTLGAANKRLAKELRRTFSEKEFVGQSQAFMDLKRKIGEVSASNATVLITGESGTGKEVSAKAIHYSSSRARGPFTTLNCAAIPESLLESELFGHVKGAFTGASTNRVGRFAQADGGTILLDEIGDMPMPLQAKILRCLQEKTIEPVGASEPKKVDVRIIAATNQNLEAAIAAGTFRQDLYFRLNVYPLVLPPLREREEDISLLAEFFADRFCAEMGKKRILFTPDAMNAMRRYPWPGNIRELENFVERLNIIAGGRDITLDHVTACFTLGLPDTTPFTEKSAPSMDTPERTATLEGTLARSRNVPIFPVDLAHKMEELERELILQALVETGGVQVKAAELLNISERSMWHRIKKLGVNIRVTKEIF